MHFTLDLSQTGTADLDIQFSHSLTKFTEIRKQLGLQRTHQQRHTKESICATMMELWAIYSHAGAREMVSLLFHEHDMSVSR
jgi:hypothetical protein